MYTRAIPFLYAVVCVCGGHLFTLNIATNHSFHKSAWWTVSKTGFICPLLEISTLRRECRRRLRVLCASSPQQASFSKRSPEEISQTPSLCHRRMFPLLHRTSRDHLQSSLCLVKHSAIKGLETREVTTSLRLLKDKKWPGAMAGRSVPSFCFFISHSLESWLDQHSLHHLSTPVFILQQTKSLLLRVAPPVWCDSCHKWRTTTRSWGGGGVPELLICLTRIADQLYPSHVQASFSAHPTGQRSFAWKAFHHFSNTCNQDYAH